MPTIAMEIEIPTGWEDFRLPKAVHSRLQSLLDRQDNGQLLTPPERQEAEELVDLAEWLSLFRLRAKRLSLGNTTEP